MSLIIITIIIALVPGGFLSAALSCVVSLKASLIAGVLCSAVVFLAIVYYVGEAIEQENLKEADNTENSKTEEKV